MAIVYKKATASTVGSAPTTVYTVATSGTQATIIGFTICNVELSNITARVILYNESTVLANILFNTVIVVGTTLNVIDAGRMILTQNDSIVVAINGGYADIVISVVEVS